MDLDATLCHCFHISRRKVVNFTRQRLPKRASQLSECFGAGSGCGWCIPYLIRIHREIVGREAVESEDISAQQYEEMRAAYRSAVARGDCRKNSYQGLSPDPEPGAGSGDGG